MRKMIPMMTVWVSFGVASVVSAAEPCTVDVAVNGLVCDFCARALEKTFGKREEVRDITVDLGSGRVSVVMQEGRTLDDATLRRLITDAGYDIRSIDRGC